MAERSNALKKAQQKYMERFSIARIRMEREKYEAVQEYAEQKGVSVNALVVSLLDKAMTEGDPREAAGGTQEYRDIFLHPDTLTVAQEAAEAAGEAVAVFIGRAVVTQAKRDETARKLGDVK